VNEDEPIEKGVLNLYHGFNELMKYYSKHGAIDRKQKELMAVAASVTTRCIPRLANHANNAVLAGAKKMKCSKQQQLELNSRRSFICYR
jgi:AhpD family alkylhydroperoxidase